MAKVEEIPSHRQVRAQANPRFLLYSGRRTKITGNSKSQITNIKQITMTPVKYAVHLTGQAKIPNPKPLYDLEERTFQRGKIKMTEIRNSKNFHDVS